jgi:uncharacterized membrane protein
MTQESPPEIENSAAVESKGAASTINRLVYWISRHWLAIFNTFVAIYVGLPLLAPVLMNVGATAPARVIYTIYSPLCHQMASRSFFLYGEQVAYPRAISGSSLTPIEAYMPSLPEFEGASQDPENWPAFLLAARRFVGNEQMGYKMALCERDMAIYVSVLFTGLLYGLLRRRINIKPLPFWAFLIIGLGPIALDGFSQLFSQYLVVLTPYITPPLERVLPLRESTPFLRTLTGAVFGFALVWMTYPHIDASMQRTEADQRQKLAASNNPG